MTARTTAGRRPIRRTVAALIAVQLAVVAGVAAYAYDAPLDPDRGLQQLDAITLHERVAGVPGVAGQPTLYVATGPLAVPRCAALARRLLAGRGRPSGLPRRFSLVLLVPGTGRAQPAVDPSGGATVIRADPSGRLAESLALPRAASRCEPGYAVVDPAGYVRYRSYDPGYPDHSQEQGILLDAVRS